MQYMTVFTAVFQCRRFFPVPRAVVWGGGGRLFIESIISKYLWISFVDIFGGQINANFWPY